MTSYSRAEVMHPQQQESVGTLQSGSQQDSSSYPNLSQSHTLGNLDGSNQTPPNDSTQQMRNPGSPSAMNASITDQSQQSHTSNVANEAQQTPHNHGFIQIYQNGKNIVIPLSQSLLQTLSSRLGAATTSQQSSNQQSVSSPNSPTNVPSVDFEIPVALEQQTGPQALQQKQSVSHSSGNTIQQQMEPPKSDEPSSPATSYQRGIESNGPNTDQQILSVDDQQVNMNERTSGPASFIQDFMG
ncbi:hypothetical protein EGW08_002883 [Elysia chlorotica]|uniref:Uncharacterized protein n=1 Tax=Elysia chlorotica TaxID=188477 RepID=A0A3S1CD02_ELYCH|nr:hypothetical protein EGW08_002883 [Elysia chlorotica]